MFFATHRLHWMLEMDQIIVLDQGKLVETGTHEELIEQQWNLLSTSSEDKWRGSQ